MQKNGMNGKIERFVYRSFTEVSDKDYIAAFPFVSECKGIFSRNVQPFKIRTTHRIVFCQKPIQLRYDALATNPCFLRLQPFSVRCKKSAPVKSV